MIGVVEQGWNARSRNATATRDHDGDAIDGMESIDRRRRRRDRATHDIRAMATTSNERIALLCDRHGKTGDGSDEGDGRALASAALGVDDDAGDARAFTARKMSKVCALGSASVLLVSAMVMVAQSATTTTGRGGVTVARGARFLGTRYASTNADDPWRKESEGWNRAAALGTTNENAVRTSAYRIGSLVEEGAVNPWLSAQTPDWTKAAANPEAEDKLAMTATVPAAKPVSVSSAVPGTITQAGQMLTTTLTSSSPKVTADPEMAAMCNFAACDAKYMMVDDRCLPSGGLGCVADTGCRYCAVDNAPDGWKLQGLPKCAQCVCDKFGLHGCDATLRKAPKTNVIGTQTFPQTALTVLPTNPTTNPVDPLPGNAPLRPDMYDAAIGRSEYESSLSSHSSLAQMCNFEKCDAGLRYQMYDHECKANGGLGCIGKSGCRFCSTDDDSISYQDGLPSCAPCVCEKYGVRGCHYGSSSMNTVLKASQPTAQAPWTGSSGSSAWYTSLSEKASSYRSSDSSTSSSKNSQPSVSTVYQTQPAAYRTQPAVAYQTQPAVAYQTQPAVAYQTQPAVAYQTQPAVAYQTQPVANQPQPAATYQSQPATGVIPDPERFAKSGLGSMQETGPVDPLPEYFRIGANRVDWQQTKFGESQSCQARCQSIGKTCSDAHWPRDLNQLRDVISRTTPSGATLTCNEIRAIDPIGHCSGVSALSGRCFLNPPTGVAATSCASIPRHSDCTTFCPCAKL